MKTLLLFDFDGTLADTAPDLAAAANHQRRQRGLADLPLERLRPYASHGARGLLHAALDMSPEHPDYAVTRQQFLDAYEADMTRHTRLFPGIAELLVHLAQDGIAWGIVTNKASRLALPLVAHLQLTDACQVVVCGDTTAHIKPHPEPLLHAARSAGYLPEQCLYVGDDLRDVQAGHAAGMPVIAAAYGYCSGQDVTSWQADAIAHQVAELYGAIRGLLAKPDSSQVASPGLNRRQA